MGVASFVIGLLALLNCWLPIIGLLVIPLAIIGGVLGLVGVLSAGQKVSTTWPVAGLVMNGLALLVAIVATGILVAPAAA